MFSTFTRMTEWLFVFSSACVSGYDFDSYDMSQDLIYSDEDDEDDDEDDGDDDDPFNPNMAARKPLEPHPRITQLTDEVTLLFSGIVHFLNIGLNVYIHFFLFLCPGGRQTCPGADSRGGATEGEKREEQTQKNGQWSLLKSDV